MIRTKYEIKRRTENVSVVMDAEFEDDITYTYSNYDDMYRYFSNYTFPDFWHHFYEYDCRLTCYSKFYLQISSNTGCLYFDQFLVSNMDIYERGEDPILTTVRSLGNRESPEEIDRILRDPMLFETAKVIVHMEIIFFLPYRFRVMTAYERAERRMDRPLTEYEIEQLEDLEDNIDCYSDEDDSVKSPFVTDKCCICLTEKPEIVLVPCLHKSVCLQCEEKGKLRKCPTCRRKITKKIKI